MKNELTQKIIEWIGKDELIDPSYNFGIPVNLCTPARNGFKSELRMHAPELAQSIIDMILQEVVPWDENFQKTILSPAEKPFEWQAKGMAQERFRTIHTLKQD